MLPRILEHEEEDRVEDNLRRSEKEGKGKTRGSVVITPCSPITDAADWSLKAKNCGKETAARPQEEGSTTCPNLSDR